MTGIVIRGFGKGDKANISNTAVETGMMLGAARAFEGNNHRLDPGSNWTFPIYCCATALKASIKDVTFRINSSALLSNLQVVSISLQKYTTNADVPLWAVENSAMNISEISPFGGVVEDKYETNPDLFTQRSPSLIFLLVQGQKLFFLLLPIPPQEQRALKLFSQLSTVLPLPPLEARLRAVFQIILDLSTIPHS